MGFYTGEAYQIGNGFDTEGQADNDQAATHDIHNMTIESVLEIADGIARSVEPGHDFDLPIGTTSVDGSVDLEIALPMEARRHNLLVIKVGEAVTQMQVCSPYEYTGIAAD